MTEEDNLTVGNVVAAVASLEKRNRDELVAAVALDTFCWCRNTFWHLASEAWQAFGVSKRISVPRLVDRIVTDLKGF